MDIQNVPTPEVKMPEVTNPESTQEAPKNKLGLFALIGVVLVTVLGGGVYYFGFAGSSNPPTLEKIGGEGLQGFSKLNIQTGKFKGKYGQVYEKSDEGKAKPTAATKATAVSVKPFQSVDPNFQGLGAGMVAFTAEVPVSLEDIVVGGWIVPKAGMPVIAASYDPVSGKFISIDQSVYKTTVNPKYVVPAGTVVLLATDPSMTVSTYLTPLSEEPKVAADFSKFHPGWTAFADTKSHIGTVKDWNVSSLWGIGADGAYVELNPANVDTSKLANYMFWVEFTAAPAKAEKAAGETATTTAVIAKAGWESGSAKNIIVEWEGVSLATKYVVTVDSDTFTISPDGATTAEKAKAESIKVHANDYILQVKDQDTTKDHKVKIIAFKGAAEIATKEVTVSAKAADGAETVATEGTLVVSTVAGEDEKISNVTLPDTGSLAAQEYSKFTFKNTADTKLKVTSMEFKVTGGNCTYIANPKLKVVGTAALGAAVTCAESSIKFPVSFDVTKATPVDVMPVFDIAAAGLNREIQLGLVEVKYTSEDGKTEYVTPDTLATTPLEGQTFNVKAAAEAEGSVEVGEVKITKAEWIDGTENNLITHWTTVAKATEYEVTVTEKKAGAVGVKYAIDSVGTMTTSPAEVQAVGVEGTAGVDEHLTFVLLLDETKAYTVKVVAYKDTTKLAEGSVDVAAKVGAAEGQSTYSVTAALADNEADKEVAIGVNIPYSKFVFINNNATDTFKLTYVKFELIDGECAYIDKDKIDVTVAGVDKEATCAKEADNKEYITSTFEQELSTNPGISVNPEFDILVGAAEKTISLNLVSFKYEDTATPVKGYEKVYAAADVVKGKTFTVKAADAGISDKLELTSETASMGYKKALVKINTDTFSPDATKTFAGLEVSYGTTKETLTATAGDAALLKYTFATSNNVSVDGNRIYIANLDAAQEYTFTVKMAYDKDGVVDYGASASATGTTDPLDISYTANSGATEAKASDTGVEYGSFNFENKSTSNVKVIGLAFQLTKGACADIENATIATNIDQDTPTLNCGAAEGKDYLLTGVEVFEIAAGNSVVFAPKSDISAAAVANTTIVELGLVEVTYEDSTDATKTYSVNFGTTPLTGSSVQIIASLNYGYASLFDDMLDSLFNLFR